MQSAFYSALFSVIALGAPTTSSQEPAVPPVKQEQQEQQRPETANVTGEKSALLKEGTEVHLKLAQTMTSKTSTVGELVEMVLAEDLKVGENVVVRKGARVLGTVVGGKKSEKQKSEAHSLSVRADHIKVGDSVINLTGEQAGVGKRNKGEMVTFTILFGLPGFLASSNKKFMIPEGTPATAYVDEDIQLPILAPTPN